MTSVLTTERRIEPLAIHTDEYELPTEEINDVNIEKEDDWCNNNGVDEMNSLQPHEQQKLIRHLKDISITLDDYLQQNLSRTEALNTVSRKYSYYKCTIKEDLMNSKSNSDTFILLYKYALSALATVFTMYAVYQIYRVLMKKSYTVGVITSLIYICIFNPVFSAFTVTTRYMMYLNDSASNKLYSSNKSYDISNIEQSLESIIKNKLQSTKDINKFCSQFNDDNNTNLEKNATSAAESKKPKTSEIPLITNMNITEKLNTFFSNQFEFISKNNNQNISITENKSLDECYDFFVGKNTKNTLMEHVNVTDEDDTLVFESAPKIRNNASKILSYIEGHSFRKKYASMNDENFYESFFVIRLNETIKDFKTKRTESFVIIADILSKLYKLGLPEYYYLRKFIFGDTDTSIGGNEQYPIIFKSESKLQTEHQNDIKLISDRIVDYITTKTEENNGVFEFDIEEYYLKQNPQYKESESIVLDKVMYMLNSLSNTRLPSDFRTKYLVSFDLINEVLMFYCEPISTNSARIVDYFMIKINSDRHIHPENKFVFIHNMKKIITSAYAEAKTGPKKSALFFKESAQLVPNHKYISFEDFNIKLLLLNKSHINTFLNNVTEAKDNLKFYMNNIINIDKTDENTSEKDVIYDHYIYIFTVISALVLINTIFTTYCNGHSMESFFVNKEWNMNDLCKDDTNSSLMISSIYFSIWIVMVVLLNTYSINRKTYEQYNSVTKRKNTEDLKRQLNIFSIVLKTYNTALNKAVDIETSTLPNVGILHAKKRLYSEYIKLMDIYEKCNHIKTKLHTQPFPTGNVLTSLFLLFVMCGIIYVTVRNRPSTSFNYKNQTGGSTNQQTSLNTNRLVKSKDQITFDNISLAFSILIFSLYFSFQVFNTTFTTQSHLNSGKLYLNSKCL
jgi:hypothetical protein|tara:strand:+ start:190 stop:2907 length:2718 start_codon:yes stop_codon:yes gene_type:complete